MGSFYKRPSDLFISPGRLGHRILCPSIGSRKCSYRGSRYSTKEGHMHNIRHSFEHKQTMATFPVQHITFSYLETKQCAKRKGQHRQAPGVQNGIAYPRLKSRKPFLLRTQINAEVRVIFQMRGRLNGRERETWRHKIR